MENQTRNRHEYGSVSGRFPCQVCRPLSSVPFYHRHHSTRTMLNTMHARDVHTIDCLVCKTAHPTDDTDERLVVFFSTSTLHNIVYEPEVKSPYCFNLETICGGTIDLLRRNFSLLYYQEKRPMDIIFSGGLNDLNDDTDLIVHNLFQFKKEVLEQNKSNTFFIVQMLRPPMYCWFPKNGPPPATRGSRPYANLLPKVDYINEIIAKMNKPLGYPNQTSFEYLGLRSFKKSTGVVYQHVMPRWREHLQGKGPAMCLHLTDEFRVVAFNKIIGHITNRLKN